MKKEKYLQSEQPTRCQCFCVFCFKNGTGFANQYYRAHPKKNRRPIICDECVAVMLENAIRTANRPILDFDNANEN